MLRHIRRRAAEVYHAATDERYRAFNAQRKIVDLDQRTSAASDTAKQLPRSRGGAAVVDPEAVKHLAEAGWVGLPGLVAPEWVAEIRAYFADKLARDPYRADLGRFKAPDEVPPQTHVSHYDNEQIVRAPHLLAIANDPRVLGVVEAWMGAKPTLAALRVWWSTPTAEGEAEHAELFHRDVDDLQFVKLFVYLTDVTEDTGPHIYVEGSQRMNRLTEIGRYGDDEVGRTFGEQAIRCFTGPAGTAFLENTYGMHRGLPPRAAPRLIFQPLYAQRPLIFGPKKPVIGAAEVGLTLDPYINRVFVRP
jgi:hypothetical protein